MHIIVNLTLKTFASMGPMSLKEARELIKVCRNSYPDNDFAIYYLMIEGE